MNDNEQTLYASYNSLSRYPLMLGVPVEVLAIMMLTTIISGFVGVAAFGFYGIILPILLIFCLLLIRGKCADDSRAVAWMQWDLKGWLDRLKCSNNVTSFTSNVDHLKTLETTYRGWLKDNSVKETAA